MNRFKTLKDHVYDYIADQILNGNLRAEEKVNESTICEELSISRTPVREALIQLATEGILDNVQRKGFVVKSLTEKEAEELYVIIGTLDGLCARLACPVLTEREFRDMQFYIDSMYLAIESSNYEMYLSQQKIFHQVYIDKCGNDTLIDYIARVKSKLLRQRYLDNPDEDMRKVLRMTNDEHQKILDYLKAGDGQGASDYLSKVHWSSRNAYYEQLNKNEN